MAKLGFHPGHVLVALGAKIEELINEFTQQSCSNTLWALAVLQVSTAAYNTCSTSMDIVCRVSVPSIAGCQAKTDTTGVLDHDVGPRYAPSRQSGLMMHAVCPGCPGCPA